MFLVILLVVISPGRDQVTDAKGYTGFRLVSYTAKKNDCGQMEKCDVQVKSCLSTLKVFDNAKNCTAHYVESLQYFDKRSNEFIDEEIDIIFEEREGQLGLDMTICRVSRMNSCLEIDKFQTQILMNSSHQIVNLDFTFRGNASILNFTIKGDCSKDFYGNDCHHYCSIGTENSTHYMCDQPTGIKMCSKDYNGDNCTIFCKNDSLYYCDDQGNKLQMSDVWKSEQSILVPSISLTIKSTINTITPSFMSTHAISSNTSTAIIQSTLPMIQLAYSSWLSSSSDVLFSHLNTAQSSVSNTGTVYIRQETTLLSSSSKQSLETTLNIGTSISTNASFRVISDSLTITKTFVSPNQSESSLQRLDISSVSQLAVPIDSLRKTDHQNSTTFTTRLIDFTKGTHSTPFVTAVMHTKSTPFPPRIYVTSSLMSSFDYTNIVTSMEKKITITDLISAYKSNRSLETYQTNVFTSIGSSYDPSSQILLSSIQHFKSTKRLLNSTSSWTISSSCIIEERTISKRPHIRWLTSTLGGVVTLCFIIFFSLAVMVLFTYTCYRHRKSRKIDCKRTMLQKTDQSVECGGETSTSLQNTRM